jgi:hypothetical protein
MFKHIILSSVLIAFVKAEGYYCPYDSLGFDGKNDLLYDYYEGNGDYWVRMGRTGWETRESYCRAKGNMALHNDAGQAKCEDSQGTCMWSGSSCEINQSKKPDCFELCQTVKDGRGLQCLGNCPNGNSDRSQLYSICDNKIDDKVDNKIDNKNTTMIGRKKKFKTHSSTQVNTQVNFKSKKLTCICNEEL